MRKIFLVFALFIVSISSYAQRFLDIYWKGKIVSSIKAADVDSMVVGTDRNARMIGFYQNGDSFHRIPITTVDSIKICKAEEEPVVYFSILGFNQELFEKQFGILDENSESSYRSFVSKLSCNDGTLLYYGVDHALEMLKNTSFPTQISSVNLITITDGLDQGSLMINNNYQTDEQYLNSINKQIKGIRVNNMPITAYSLGLCGSDVSDYSLFQHNLQKLASSSDKTFEVTNMDGVRTRLEDISNQIISISNKQTISMKIPGQSNGTKVRFTFDNNSVTNSTIYIEGTFNLSDHSLCDVTYHGIKAENGSIVQGTQNGIFVSYNFKELQRGDGNGLIPVNNIRFYYKSPTATIWQQNSEFTPDNNTQTTITHSGAIIMLVLDCSNSLDSQFSSMKNYAIDFINRITKNTVIYIQRPFGNFCSSTCSEIISGPDSKTYRVTGAATKIANTTYGNWYLDDGTGEIFIYGTLDSNGFPRNFENWGIEVGDIITVEGPKTTYRDVVELVDVTVIDITKSLITINEQSTSDSLPVEGGDLTIYLTCKGNGMSVEIPENAQHWLSVIQKTSGENPTVTFHANPNVGEDRNTKVLFKTSDGNKEFCACATIRQKGNCPIIDTNVNGFIAASVDDSKYRLAGVITKVTNSDYGSLYIKDFSGEVLVSEVGNKGDFERLGLKEGDIVTLVGKRGEYKGSAQMTGGQYESHISVTDVTIAEFLTKADDNNVYYRVKGEVKDLLDNKGKENDYGNLHVTDGTNELYVYGCYPGYGATGDARKGFIKAAGIEAGDELTMIGYKDTYNGLVELCGGIYFSHEKAK